MIVCSCNVLSDEAVRTCATQGPGCPRTPAQVYRCLGCTPRCGRCTSTIRSILTEAQAPPAAAGAGCAAGPCRAGEAPAPWQPQGSLAASSKAA